MWARMISLIPYISSSSDFEYFAQLIDFTFTLKEIFFPFHSEFRYGASKWP